MENECKVVVQLESRDMAALYRYIVSIENRLAYARLRFGAVVIVFFVLSMILFNLGNMEDLKNSLIYVAYGVVFVAIVAVLPLVYHRIMASVNERDIISKSPEELQIEGSKQYAVRGRKLEIGSVYGDLEIFGKDLEDFRPVGDYVFIKCVQGKGAHVIPVKFFASEEKRDEFLDALAALVADVR